MSDKSVITNLEARIRQLIEQHRQLGGSCRDLAAERDALQAENRSLQERIRSLEHALSRKELAESLTGRSADREKARARVNRLMREVDKCIALLSRPQAAERDV